MKEKEEEEEEAKGRRKGEGRGRKNSGGRGECKMASDTPLSEGEAGNEATSRRQDTRIRSERG